jgi:hypothetical protein
MNLSVLMAHKITDEATRSVDTYLRTNEFQKEEAGYRHARKDLDLFIYFEHEPERDMSWHYTPEEVIWFVPMTEIVLESKDYEESHRLNYEVARQVARLVAGVIYDHLAGAAYNAEGVPFEKYGMGETLPEYGSGRAFL